MAGSRGALTVAHHDAAGPQVCHGQQLQLQDRVGRQALGRHVRAAGQEGTSSPVGMSVWVYVRARTIHPPPNSLALPSRTHTHHSNCMSCSRGGAVSPAGGGGGSAPVAAATASRRASSWRSASTCTAGNPMQQGYGNCVNCRILAHCCCCCSVCKPRRSNPGSTHLPCPAGQRWRRCSAAIPPAPPAAAQRAAPAPRRLWGSSEHVATLRPSACLRGCPCCSPVHAASPFFSVYAW